MPEHPSLPAAQVSLSRSCHHQRDLARQHSKPCELLLRFLSLGYRCVSQLDIHCDGIYPEYAKIMYTYYSSVRDHVGNTTGQTSRSPRVDIRNLI